MSDIDLDAIEARANAATRGPWCWASTEEKGSGWNVGVGFAPDDENCEHPVNGEIGDVYDDETGEVREYYIDRGICEGGYDLANAAFIAHARTDIPALIARVREQEQEIAKLRENCAGYVRLCRMLADAAQDAREARKVMAREHQLVTFLLVEWGRERQPDGPLKTYDPTYRKYEGVGR